MTAPIPVARLDERIPERGFDRPDDALGAFLAWVADRGLALYPHQEEAILEVFEGRHVVLDAPTGSGKSLVATAMHFRTFASLGRAWYTAPIKALVSEKFFELCAIFGPEHVGMITGDGAVNRDAPIVCCTAEILANLALREGDDARITSVVMDEFHYYADRDRGMAWQIPLLTLKKAQFLMMSATLGDTTRIRADLVERTGRDVAEVKGAHRPVPLEFAYSMRPIHEALANLVRENKAPIYVVHFTQRDATEAAQALMSVDWCSKEEKRAIADAMKGFGFHSPFGPTMRRYVAHGVGLHHAGLLPRYRRLVERLAQKGLLKVICGTDTLGVGINVPIRTVLFTQLCKFDGEKVIILPVREFKQIAGRAGRAGFDDRGFVVVQAPAHVIENAKISADTGKKKKKPVQAPTKGYRHWDEETFHQLIERPPEPLEGRFTVDHGRLLSLMQHAQEVHGDARFGHDALLALIERSHQSAARRDELRKTTDELVEHLVTARILAKDGESWLLDPTLQRDFSLHHSLSLFLLAALATLDRDSPTYALDVVTFVEAILEHPRPVLLRQVEREKSDLIAALKADGVPYEERMEALDEVTWPKPHADGLYRFYATYSEKHPWVLDEPIRPKSVVREMAEKYASFAEYVKELGLERVEGVLLRYLSEAYKALIQNVPADLHTDGLVDLIAWLRALLGHVDASLLAEWEELVTGAPAAADAPRKLDISSDRRSFVARVRAELHALVRALSRRDWEDAARAVRRSEEGPWGPQDFEAALAPFLEEHGDVAFDHRARLAQHTVVTPAGPHQWTVRQVVFPPLDLTPDRYAIEGPEDEGVDAGTWTIEGRIDLRADTNPEGAIVEIVQIG